VRLTPDGPEPITGVVDVATDAFLGVRSATGLHRIGAEGSDAGCGVSAYHYFYGEPMDTEASTAAWQKWLTDLFPAPNPAPTLPDSLPDSAVALAFVVRRVRRRTP
jgi:hypothetical protein